MYIDDLKRKLRELKKLETRIRFQENQNTQKNAYIWNEYFSTKDENDQNVKYNMGKLMSMNHQELKEAFGEYFYHVYAQFYKENGMVSGGIYDTALLAKIGLSPNASIDQIKTKFRELAKEHHPDMGGDSAKFVEVVEIYNKLVGKK